MVMLSLFSCGVWQPTRRNLTQTPCMDVIYVQSNCYFQMCHRPFISSQLWNYSNLGLQCIRVVVLLSCLLPTALTIDNSLYNAVYSPITPIRFCYYFVDIDSKLSLLVYLSFYLWYHIVSTYLYMPLPIYLSRTRYNATQFLWSRLGV